MTTTNFYSPKISTSRNAGIRYCTRGMQITNHVTTLHFAPALWLSPFFWHHSRYLIWKPLACSLELGIGTILKNGSSHRAGAKWRVVTWFVIYIPRIQYQDCKQSVACMDVSPRLFRQGFATFEKISWAILARIGNLFPISSHTATQPRRPLERARSHTRSIGRPRVW